MKAGKMKFIAGARSLKMRVIARQTCSWFLLLLSFYALLPRVGAEEGEIALDPILLKRSHSESPLSSERLLPQSVFLFPVGWWW